MPEIFSDSIASGFTPAFDVIVHPCPEASAIIINIPGLNSAIDGYHNKYRKIGAMLTERGVGAYIQMPNFAHLYKDRGLLIEDVVATIRYAKKTGGLCGAEVPDIYLSGTSVGAVAAAAAASKPGVKKILLLAPAYTTHRSVMNRIQLALSKFKGELYIAIGEQDEFYAAKNHTRYTHIAQRATKKQVVVIPDCDHYFKGKRNGMILSKAPLWAFAGDTTFPSPQGGLELYE